MQRRGSVPSVRLTLFLTTICASASANNTVIIQSAKCIETRPRFEKEVRLAVIAPADPRHEQSMPRILPAVLLAVKAVSSAKGLLPGWNITVDHRDSKCSSIQGPLAAFDFYINRTAGRSSLSFFHFRNFLEFFAVLFQQLDLSFGPFEFLPHLPSNSLRSTDPIFLSLLLSSIRWILFHPEICLVKIKFELDFSKKYRSLLRSTDSLIADSKIRIVYALGRHHVFSYSHRSFYRGTRYRMTTIIRYSTMTRFESSRRKSTRASAASSIRTIVWR